MVACFDLFTWLKYLSSHCDPVKTVLSSFDSMLGLL